MTAFLDPCYVLYTANLSMWDRSLLAAYADDNVIFSSNKNKNLLRKFCKITSMKSNSGWTHGVSEQMNHCKICSKKKRRLSTVLIINNCLRNIKLNIVCMDQERLRTCNKYIFKEEGHWISNLFNERITRQIDTEADMNPWHWALGYSSYIKYWDIGEITVQSTRHYR